MAGLVQPAKKNIQQVNKTKERNMLDILLWVAVGAFIGWNFPQPFWAKAIQSKVQDLLAKKQ